MLIAWFLQRIHLAGVQAGCLPSNPNATGRVELLYSPSQAKLQIHKRRVEEVASWLLPPPVLLHSLDGDLRPPGFLDLPNFPKTIPD